MSNLKRRSTNEGKLLVADYERSGLSMPKFAETTGVKVCAVRYWVSKIRQERKAEVNKVHFFEVIQTSRVQEMQSSTIELPGGIRVETQELPSPEYLVDLSEHFQRKMPC